MEKTTTSAQPPTCTLLNSQVQSNPLAYLVHHRPGRNPSLVWRSPLLDLVELDHIALDSCISSRQLCMLLYYSYIGKIDLKGVIFTEGRLCTSFPMNTMITWQLSKKLSRHLNFYCSLKKKKSPFYVMSSAIPAFRQFTLQIYIHTVHSDSA